jgi:hypothetical protein
MAVTLPNGIKELFKQDKVALGMNVRLARSGEIAGIAKTTGHDFIFIDGQHALYNVETMGAIAMAANGIGITPIARVSSSPTSARRIRRGVRWRARSFRQWATVRWQARIRCCNTGRSRCRRWCPRCRTTRWWCA